MLADGERRVRVVGGTAADVGRTAADGGGLTVDGGGGVGSEGGSGEGEVMATAPARTAA